MSDQSIAHYYNFCIVSIVMSNNHSSMDLMTLQIVLLFMHTQKVTHMVG